MGRRLPNCAGCGKPLRLAVGRCRLQWLALPGKPEIGWCDACPPKDDLEFRRLKIDENGPADESMVIPVLDAIAARGSGRVGRNRQ